MTRRMHGWRTPGGGRERERERERKGERERETETENMIEKGKGEYEARVSGRVNNNARRQMSIPPPLFA